MSLKWHPDKNPDNPEATAIFILVSKAYECLTDESKKHLCEKFGNPDGNKSTQVAIALPKFLLYKENQIALLVIFFLILLVVIPTVGYLIYNESI
jgi:translocation protein SEC63